MVGWFTILVLCCVLLFTLFLLYQYPSKGTPFAVYVIVFIGWFTSFAVVTLIPYDVYLSKGGAGDKELLHIAWVSVYWTAFGLCWLILPITEKFHTSGEFSFFSRLRNAIFKQIRSFLIILALGVALILYLYFAQNLTIDKMPEILVLMSNIWGLFLVIILLGYGLVYLPKTFWRLGSLETTLTTLVLKSVPLDEANIDSKYRLDQLVGKILKISERISPNSELRKFMDIIVEKCPETSIDHCKVVGSRKQQEEDNRKIEYTDLVTLHKELKDLISENLRTQW